MLNEPRIVSKYVRLKIIFTKNLAHSRLALEGSPPFINYFETFYIIYCLKKQGSQAPADVLTGAFEKGNCALGISAGALKIGLRALGVSRPPAKFFFARKP